jgi:hypothetical protein
MWSSNGRAMASDNHWAEIKSGKVTYRIVGMPDRDFPKVPDHREARTVTGVFCLLSLLPDKERKNLLPGACARASGLWVVA